jgi:chaperonin GroES
MNIRPLYAKMIVRREVQDETTKGGIGIPDSAKEKLARGKVLAVGEGRRKDDGTLEPLTVQVGDLVMFEPYAGQEIKHEDEELLIISEGSVLAILESEDKD